MSAPAHEGHQIAFCIWHDEACWCETCEMHVEPTTRSERVDFQDRTIECADCRTNFVFTAKEQDFYERKGFRDMPKRCKPCREERKAKRAGEEGNGGSRPAGGNRELFDAVCAACKSPTRLPFQPKAGRDVYCRACYQRDAR